MGCNCTCNHELVPPPSFMGSILGLAVVVPGSVYLLYMVAQALWVIVTGKAF